jgi:hypothetical protein
MFRMLIKTTTLAIDDHSYAVRYYEARTPRGGRRYSAEIVLSGMDRFILDDDSLSSLETRATRVVPATLESRTLMKTA